MNCIDCCYNLPKDGHSYCTYEDGECVKISILEKENAELKRGYHYEAEVINGRPTGKAILVPDSLAYVKSIVKDLLDNSDEYAKQRAREFLEENK